VKNGGSAAIRMRYRVDHHRSACVSRVLVEIGSALDGAGPSRPTGRRGSRASCREIVAGHGVSGVSAQSGADSSNHACHLSDVRHISIAEGYP
jgi:hypothetical protein